MQDPDPEQVTQVESQSLQISPLLYVPSGQVLTQSESYKYFEPSQDVHVVAVPEQVKHPEQATQVDDPVNVVYPVLQDTLHVVSCSTLSSSQAVQVDMDTEQYLQLLSQSSQFVPTSIVKSSIHFFRH